MAKFIKDSGRKSVLLVVGPTISKLGMAQPFIDGCAEQGISLAVYDKVLPNPTIDAVEEALKVYNDSACDCIVALGGGSSMDCAKVVGARVARPKKPVAKMKGLLKVRKKMPMFIAIPTTAGTGSETTLAAVISNSQTHEKYAIKRPCAYSALRGYGRFAHAWFASSYHFDYRYGRAYARGRSVYRKKQYLSDQTHG